MFKFSKLIFLIAQHHPQLLLAQNKIIIEGGLEMMYFLHGNSNLPAKSAFRPLIPAGMRIVIFMFREPQVTLVRSEVHTSELQSLMRISYAVSCLKYKQ